ncbi:AAA ATPase domain-containing protein [Amycolatopsis saalfeldensis]|uniref:AAA ATPase domain-containing protein n=2 Tax=Amycolatopsis saalfeldensis TaxID=394193 RepID=A0A1H8YMY1_9PSEU|nr:AAA ATPase domain-containing protein [Amycolatopsis saalfeldensis]
MGSGKTVFLEAVELRTRSAGAHILHAAASRVEHADPLGAIDQLLRDTSLPAEFAERVAELLDEGLNTIWHSDQSRVAGGEAAVARGRWHTRMWEVLRDLAIDRPVVLIIDDAHNLDPASQQCLLYLLRRLRSARILVLLGERASARQAKPVLREELLHELRSRLIELAPLSERGIARFLADELGQDTGDALVSVCHSVTGGNPLLVWALAEDCAAAGTASEGTLPVGDAFRRAIENCVVRSEASVQLVARGLAIVGDQASTMVLGKVLGLSDVLVADALTALRDAGLLNGWCFRHEAMREVVLYGIPAEQRTSLHARAATTLHEYGAPVFAVAEQLLAADVVPSASMVRVLHEAAGQVLSAGEPRSAIGFLRLANRSTAGGRLDVATRSALAWVEWQLDPASVVRHIPALRVAFKAHQLGGQGIVKLFAYLLWHGRITDALDMLEDVQRAQSGEDAGPPDAVDIRTLRFWVGHLYPGAAHPAVADEAHQGAPLLSAPQPLKSASLVAHMHDSAHAEKVLIQAEQILHSSRMDDMTPVSITSALVAMIYSDRLSCARSWCDSFLEEAAVRRMTTWHGLLAALGSVINFRQGRLEAASAQAHRALTVIPAASWGVGVGLPLAGALLAATATGDLAAANSYLSMPVPDVMFKTPFALHYLHARGRHLLANNHFHAALGDFTACGELMTSWNVDAPALVPWRSDSAMAYLGLGQSDQARRLVDEQVVRLAPGNSRARGISLRVRALTEDVVDRPAVLREAIDVLQDSGDRLEAALAYADLSQAHYARHDHRLASKAARSARELAKECGAVNLLRALPPEAGHLAPHELPGPRVPGDLSAAERKVAALASKGLTNQQIANRLHVTISTVEQHLTKAYRKLNVAGRAELPLELRLEPSGPRP